MKYLQRVVYTQALSDPNFVNHWYKLVDRYIEDFLQEDFAPAVITFQAIDVHGSIIDHIEFNALNHIASIVLNCANGKRVRLDYVYNKISGFNYNEVGQVVLFDEWSAGRVDGVNTTVHEMALHNGHHIRSEGTQFTWSLLN